MEMSRNDQREPDMNKPSYFVFSKLTSLYCFIYPIVMMRLEH